MVTELKTFDSKNMSLSFSFNDSYSRPIAFGSLQQPLDGSVESVTEAVPVWVKNTGTAKLHNITIMAYDGIVDAVGGKSSSTDDAFIELSLDNNSRLPQSQQYQPSTFEKALDSNDSAKIFCNHIVDINNIPKSITSIGADNDARTMMPGEYCIVWLRCAIDNQRSVSGLPTSSGIKNITLHADAVVEEIGSNYSNLPLSSRIFIETTLSIWHFDTGEGDIAFDSKGVNNGIIYGCSWYNIGVSEKCIQLNSSNDKIMFGNPDNFNIKRRNTAFEIWLKSPEDHCSNGLIFSKIDGNIGYSLTISNNGSLLFFMGDNQGNTVVLSGGDYLNDTGWHYIVIEVNFSIMEAKMTVNRENNYTIGIGNISGSIENSADFIVGDGFTGRIDEMSVFNRILSNTEKEENFNSLWDAYLFKYGITDNGNYVTDNNGRVVVDEF